MKKTITAVLALSVLLSATACAGSAGTAPESTPPAETAVVPEAAPVQLTNKMTAGELEQVSRHALTLLDPPEESERPAETDEHTVSVEFRTLTIDEMRENIELAHADYMSDEAYQEALLDLEEKIKNGETSVNYSVYVLVDGILVQHIVPETEVGKDGKAFRVLQTTWDEEGNSEPQEYSFTNMEDYIAFIREYDAGFDYDEDMIERDVQRMQVAYAAMLDGSYETLPAGSVDAADDSLYDDPRNRVEDHRDVWEYDRAEVEAIRDSVDEISIYDEEMERSFTVHVTLPPGYDPEQTYPVFFLTDGIWRFGNCPALRKCMENGEAAPVILVSLYYSYDILDEGQSMRFYDLVINRELLLNFITDNLMPYLGENYPIDYQDSTLYGHSDGGVFAHYALFNSDKFENQPFGHYIIGSPAFWGLYHQNQYIGIGNDNVLNDYDYFDRNDTLKKTVFLCAGSQEDPDYAANYREGDDTTLEGVAKFKERLEAHNADLTYQLYESHHYQYIPEMLTEYLKATYPYQPAD